MILLPRGSPPPFRRMAGTRGQGVKPDVYYREHCPPMSTVSGIRSPHDLICQQGTQANQAVQIGPAARLINGRTGNRSPKVSLDHGLSKSRLAGHIAATSMTRTVLDCPVTHAESQNARPPPRRAQTTTEKALSAYLKYCPA